MLTSVRRFHEEWERSASIELHDRVQHTTINYYEHDRILETNSESSHESVATAWFNDEAKGLESVIVVDTNTEAADVSATCQQLLDRAGRLGEAVGVGADANELRVGDQIQTRATTTVVSRQATAAASSTEMSGLSRGRPTMERSSPITSATPGP